MAHLETVEAIYRGWGRGDFTVGFDLFERNVALVLDPGIPESDGAYVGREAVRRYMRGFLAAWDRVTIAAESIEESGDTVFVKVRQTGVGLGSGAPAELRYWQLWTFRGGKVIRLDSILDEAEAREAAGLSADRAGDTRA